MYETRLPRDYTHAFLRRVNDCNNMNAYIVYIDTERVYILYTRKINVFNLLPKHTSRPRRRSRVASERSAVAVIFILVAVRALHTRAGGGVHNLLIFGVYFGCFACVHIVEFAKKKLYNT